MSNPSAQTDRSAGYVAALTLAALGVVFGDIGTSPLYALRECFHGSHGVEASAANILGVLSLIVWALVLIISIKYLGFVLRADNRGEGGVLALMALADPEKAGRPGKYFVALGLFGAALLYGDGVITPAISVLSAVEGLKVGTAIFDPYILPITIIILIGLFVLQQFGTARIGTLFGPIILIWFTTIALIGIRGIFQDPSVLRAFSPHYALDFFAQNQWKGFGVLGSVFLAVTGGEALYADMGHFGRRPIQLGWFFVAFPALILNYLGQGAVLLNNPSAVSNPFFLAAPEWSLYPLVVLATFATIIASQAVISGAFSLTSQAVQLGLLPRLVINHTSSEEKGQIYVPRVNWTLLIATIWLVLEFRSSSHLAAAYGIAVSTTMVITTLLIFFVARHVWNWSLFRIIGLVTLFLVVDLAFFGANIIKVAQGGWFPLALGGILFFSMTTWKKGRAILSDRLKEKSVPWNFFFEEIERNPPARVPGTAVFMTSNPAGLPPALVHNVKHNKVLHERIVIMMVTTEGVPHIGVENRVAVEAVRPDFYKVVCRYGFKDRPNVPAALQLCRNLGLEVELSEVTYFLGRETLLATSRPGMPVWREKLFAVMSANAQRATLFFRIPAAQVIEIGLQVEL